MRKASNILMVLVGLSFLAACSAAPGTPVAGTLPVPATGGTPTGVPTAAQTAEPSATIPVDSGGSTTIITRADQGKTITLSMGSQFLLELGADYNWTVSVSNEQVIGRMVNITVIRGAQGVYEARQAGASSLSAVGDLPCRSEKPACAAPSLNFEVQIIVQ